MLCDSVLINVLFIYLRGYVRNPGWASPTPTKPILKDNKKIDSVSLFRAGIF